MHPKIYAFLLLGFVCIFACLPKEKARVESNKFTKFKLIETCKDDPLILEIKRDMVGRASLVELMEFYAEELKKDASPDSPYLKKLEKLFGCGRVKEAKGHFYGLTIVLKKGDHPYGDFLNKIWGATLSGVSPWDGKIFNLINTKELKFYTEGLEKGEIPTYFGINCFKKYEKSPLNVASIAVLTFWMNLKEAPLEEKQRYGYDKKGGLFIAKREKSLDLKSKGKAVFQLNYRWRRLKNPIPLKYLIDEMVEIADGLYLGKLLFATQRLLEDYDPHLAPSAYQHENYGYFLLMDETWTIDDSLRRGCGQGQPQAGKPAG